MFKGEATPSIVATPLYDDGVGYQRSPLCCLCDERIRSATCVMLSLMADPEQLLRPAHPKCGREYSLYRLAMSR